MAEQVEFPAKGKLWATDPLAELPIRVGSSGPAAEKPLTVFQRFKLTVDRQPNQVAIGVKRGGAWKNWSWKQYYDEALMFGSALISLDVQPGAGIGIIGFNSPEWFISDLGAIAAGCIAAGIYTTNGPDACHYVAEHCEAAVVVVENDFQLKKFIQIRDRLPKLKALVIWDGKAPEGSKDIYTWADFMKLGSAVPLDQIQKRIDALSPGKCCTLIYTSGTTGMPKAVMVSQDNVTWTAKTVIDALQITGDDSMISYLPLSHIAAQMLDIHGPIYAGFTVYFAQPDALKGSLVETMKEVQPTLFLGVPRVWEKMQEKMLSVGAKTTGMKKTIATWAKGKGLEGSYAEQRGEDKPWGFFFADKLVFQKVKEALGLNRVRFCATAAAPISRETLDYFMSLYIPILEIYGMSECTGPQTVNRPGKHKTGSAGPALPGTELKIADPDKEGNGEICFRGRHIFMGYMHNDKATAEAIDNEGWLHSGDVGVVDKDGFLYITGRIKELIITAGGENIPPVLIEDEIKKELAEYVSNIMVVGDRKKFLAAVFTLKLAPNPQAAQGEYAFLDELAKETKQAFAKNGIEVTTAAEAAKNEAVLKLLTAGVERANKKAISNAQRIQKFIIVPQDFTIEGNELTPTMKLKRRVVVEKYKDEIEKMYDVPDAS